MPGVCSALVGSKTTAVISNNPTARRTNSRQCVRSRQRRALCRYVARLVLVADGESRLADGGPSPEFSQGEYHGQRVPRRGAICLRRVADWNAASRGGLHVDVVAGPRQAMTCNLAAASMVAAVIRWPFARSPRRLDHAADGRLAGIGGQHLNRVVEQLTGLGMNLLARNAFHHHRILSSNFRVRSSKGPRVAGRSESRARGEPPQ